MAVQILVISKEKPRAANPTAQEIAFNRRSTKVHSKITEPSETSLRESLAYDGGFEQHLVDHGIYPDNFEFLDGRDAPRSINHDEIIEHLERRLPSPSPTTFTNEAFFAFQKTNSLALTEAEMMAQPVATVAGDTNILSQRKLLFDHLEPLTDGKIAKAKPG